MTNRRSIGLIGLGEVGQVLADDLNRNGDMDLCAWDRLFPRADSEPRRAAAALPFLKMASCMAEAVRTRAIVISAVTAGECRAAALEAAPALAPGTYFLDLNSVSPRSKVEAAHAVESAGGRYVEAAVMSPIAPHRMASPVWLGGPHAAEFLPTPRRRRGGTGIAPGSVPRRGLAQARPLHDLPFAAARSPARRGDARSCSNRGGGGPRAVDEPWLCRPAAVGGDTRRGVET